MGKKINYVISKTARGILAVAGEEGLVYTANRMNIVRRHGKMLELKIDKCKKQLSLSILLKGEKEPTEICLELSEIVREANHLSVRVESASSSRAWVSALMSTFVLGKSWAVPEKYVIFVNDFLE
jgi:hypothetical protein